MSNWMRQTFYNLFENKLPLLDYKNSQEIFHQVDAIWKQKDSKGKKISKATLIFFAKSYKMLNVGITFGLEFHKIKTHQIRKVSMKRVLSLYNNQQIVLDFQSFPK